MISNNNFTSSFAGGVHYMDGNKMRHLNNERNYEFFMNLIKEYDDFILASETDLNGVITYVSKRFAKLTGYTRDELIGKPHNIVRDPKVPAVVFKKLWDKLQKDEEVELEFSSKKKDGTIYWVEAKIYPIYENGQKIGYRALKSDITALKQLEILNKRLEDTTMELSVSNEELSAQNSELSTIKDSLELQTHDLERNLTDYNKLLDNNNFLLKVTKTLNEDIDKEKKKVEKFKSEMITIFTHELKTPLNAIINFSDYIYRNLQKELTPKKKEKLISLAQKINENGLIELNMVQNILEISKENIDNNAVEKKELMNLKHIVKSVVDRYMDAYDKKVSLELDDVECNIDIQKFTMIFDNLFSNALKYSNSEVLVTLNSSESKYYLSIEDDGEGIKEEDREKIFELFEQLDTDSLVREKSGTGVGLYTVKILCSQIHCKVDIDISKKLGGAKFILTSN